MSPISKQDTGNGQAQRQEVRKGSYHIRTVLQHDRNREDGSRCHSQVEATTSISQIIHQENEFFKP